MPKGKGYPGTKKDKPKPVKKGTKSGTKKGK
jgi:hypothetical protein